MSEVKRITLANGQTIYVEMDSAEILDAPQSSQTVPFDIAEGAEGVGFKEDIVDAMEALKNNIQVMADTVNESLQAHQPEEWSLEVNIGFKGKVNPIPVILSSEASGGIKVTAKWKKPGS